VNNFLQANQQQQPLQLNMRATLLFSLGCVFAALAGSAAAQSYAWETVMTDKLLNVGKTSGNQVAMAPCGQCGISKTMVTLSDGNIAVCYLDYDEHQAYVTITDKSFNSIVAPAGLGLAFPRQFHSTCDLLAIPTGGFWVTLGAAPTSGHPYMDAHVKRFNDDGSDATTGRTGWWVANTGTAPAVQNGNQRHPYLCHNGARDTVMIVWDECPACQGGASNGVMFRIFSTGGDQVANEPTTVYNGPGEIWQGTCAALDNGEWFITYSVRAGGDWDVYRTVFNGAGTAATHAHSLVHLNTASQIWQPQPIVLNSGVVVTFYGENKLSAQ
jgi:hypothetical protein